MATYLITRTPGKAADFARALREQEGSAQVIYAPILEAVASQPDDWEEVAFALIRGEFSWVTFTSVNGVLGLEALARSLDQSLVELLGAAQIAAVGRATQEALTQRGLIVDFVPQIQSAAGMVDEWLIDEEWDSPLGETVLAVQGSTASSTLEEGLTDYGYTVAPLVVYNMVPYPAEQALTAPDDGEEKPLTLEEAVSALATTDVLVATSPLLLRSLANAAGGPLPATVAIGASTEQAAHNLPQHQRPSRVALAASPAPADLAAAALTL